MNIFVYENAKRQTPTIATIQYILVYYSLYFHFIRNYSET